MSYFCVFCPKTFKRSGWLSRHLAGHLKNTMNVLNDREKKWIEDFISFLRKEQHSKRDKIDHAFGDCIVCERLGHHKTIKFPRQTIRFEEHIRSHLQYKAYYCIICDSKQEDNSQKTFIKSSYGETIHVLKQRPEKVYHGLRPNKSTVQTHVLDKHVGKCVTTRVPYEVDVFKINDFVGKKSIQALETLIHSWLDSMTGYATVMRIQSNWTKQDPITLQQCSPNTAIIDKSLKERLVREAARIDVPKEKSCFCSTPRQDRRVTRLTSQKRLFKSMAKKKSLGTFILQNEKKTRTSLRSQRKVEPVKEMIIRKRKSKDVAIFDAKKRTYTNVLEEMVGTSILEQTTSKSRTGLISKGKVISMPVNRMPNKTSVTITSEKPKSVSLNKKQTFCSYSLRSRRVIREDCEEPPVAYISETCVHNPFSKLFEAYQPLDMALSSRFLEDLFTLPYAPLEIIMKLETEDESSSSSSHPRRGDSPSPSDSRIMKIIKDFVYEGALSDHDYTTF